MKVMTRNIILVILLLVVGFASITTALLIDGDATISTNKNDFDVFFYNAVIDGLVSPNVIGETKKVIDYETKELSLVGDSSVLNYTVMNNSTQYDADVSINCTIPQNDLVNVLYEPNSMVVSAGKKGYGSITVTLLRALTTDKEIKISCTLETVAVARTSAVNKNKLDLYDVVVLGDSIMYGYGNNDKGLDEYLMKDGLAKKNLKLAVPSSMLMTSEYVEDKNQLIFDQQITKTLFSEAALIESDATIIMNGGINDIVFNFKYPSYTLGFESRDDLSSADFFTNVMASDNLMKRIYDSLSGLSMTFPEANIIYIKPRLLRENGEEKYYKAIADINEDIRLFNEALDLWKRRIGSSKYSNVIILDPNEIIEENDLKTGDNIHWGATAYEKIYAQIKLIVKGR